MSRPSWLAGIFAGLMVVVGIYCLARLVIARIWRLPAEHDIDTMHAVMGIAMAGMLAGGLRLLPSAAWAVVFAAGAAWFAWQVGRAHLSQRAGGGAQASAAAGGTGGHRLHHGPHLIMCGAMVYMLLAIPAAAGSGSMSGGMSGTGTGGGAASSQLTIFTFIFAAFFCGYAVWEIDRLPRLARAATARVPVAVAVAAMPGQAGASAPEAAVTATETTAPAAAHTAISPWLSSCCAIAMAVTMGYMFVTML